MYNLKLTEIFLKMFLSLINNNIPNGEKFQSSTNIPYNI